MTACDMVFAQLHHQTGDELIMKDVVCRVVFSRHSIYYLQQCRRCCDHVMLICLFVFQSLSRTTQNVADGADLKIFYVDIH